MAGTEGMSSGEIMWAMLILLVVLSVVTFFFCCLPVYKALQARFTYWEDPENDPRWNSDQFQFSPTSPRLATKVDRNKYNRLSTSSVAGDSVSRGSSFRNQSVFPRFDDQIEIKLPPAYSDIYDPGSGDLSSLGSPPEYYSHSPSDTEDGSNEHVGKPAVLAICSEVGAVEKPSRVPKKAALDVHKTTTPAVNAKNNPAEEPIDEAKTNAEPKLTATQALRKARADAAKANRQQKPQQQQQSGEETSSHYTPAKPAPSSAAAAAPETQVPGVGRPNRRGEAVKASAASSSAGRPAQSSAQGGSCVKTDSPEVFQPPRKVYKKPRKSPN